VPSDPTPRGNPAGDAEPIRWIDRSDTPWPAPVLDVRPVTLTMVATSKDPQMAANAVSYGRDDGTGFLGQLPAADRTTHLTLRYRVDPILADGAVFLPTTMEHKWAVYYHSGQLLFVRSWQRRVVVSATVIAEPGWVEVVEARGAFTNSEEPPSFTSAAVDFIIRTHALRVPCPAPLVADPAGGLRAAALWSFSMFGSFAGFATHHRFALPPPERPLRSHSLFHIAVARGDLAAAQAQLDLGVPVALLAGDGLTAMQWALAKGDVGMMAWLLDRGLSVDARSEQGATPLMNAVQSNSLDAIVWLLDHGADAGACDDRGFTGLHRAAEMGLTDAVSIMLERGASPNPTAQGHTPLSFAKARGHSEIIRLLGGDAP
jgi:hypothetical protein